MSFEQAPGGWRIAGPQGTLVAREVVVALGPWSDLVFRPLGYAIVGGLLFSQLITLYITPVIYLGLEGLRERAPSWSWRPMARRVWRQRLP